MYRVSRAGLLVPDIPLEETGPVRQVATAAGLELVLLTTPTTPLERMEAIAKVSQGFVYLVSVTGTPPQPVASLCLLSVAMASQWAANDRQSKAAYADKVYCACGLAILVGHTKSQVAFSSSHLSCAGVTGQRDSMEARVEGLIDKLHGITDKAVAVGFGVSGPEQVMLQQPCMTAHLKLFTSAHQLHERLEIAEE